MQIILLFAVIAAVVIIFNRKKKKPAKATSGAGKGKKSRNRRTTTQRSHVTKSGGGGYSQKKWNRVHFFRKKKDTKKKKGHPVYVYGQSGDYSKYILITHTPPTGHETEYKKLLHNIDPEEEGKRDSYIKKQYEIDRNDNLKDPEKNYRIHKEDMETINKHKK